MRVYFIEYSKLSSSFSSSSVMHSAAVHRAHHNHHRAMKNSQLHSSTTTANTAGATATTHHSSASCSTAAIPGSLRNAGPPGTAHLGNGGGVHRLAAAGNPGYSPGCAGAGVSGSAASESKRDAAQLLLWTINEWSKNKSQAAGSQGQGHLMPAESRRARRIQRKVRRKA